MIIMAASEARIHAFLIIALRYFDMHIFHIILADLPAIATHNSCHLAGKKKRPLNK
jgi:hypothetical protein